MDENNGHYKSSDCDQLIKYAKALSVVYKSEKNKRKELKTSQKQLVKYADALNNTVKELKAKNKELEEAYLDTIHRLVLAAEYKDNETGRHIERMSRYSALIAEKLGLTAIETQNILYASPMHDVGKIAIPDEILMKSSKLTKNEFNVMKKHSTLGAALLSNSNSQVLKLAEKIALSHHERWNGAGYPQGISGEKIPIAGKIVALADVFDALTSKRSYKDPYPVEIACKIIEKERGKLFDPDVVDVFLENIDEIIKIKNEVDSLKNMSKLNFNYSKRDRKEMQ